MNKLNMKERIIRVARERFFRLGFYKVSIDSLVGELRTSKSSIYNHFNTKNDIVKEVLYQLNREINTALERITSNRGLNFREKLGAVMEYTSRLFESTNAEFLNDLRLYTPELWDEYQEMREARINKYYKKLFEDGRQEGIIKDDIDSDLMLFAYLKLTEISVTADLFRKIEMGSHKVYQQISRIFLEGILKKK